MRLAALLLLAGCFGPTFADGEIPCGPAGECPATLSCAADKKCWHQGKSPEPCKTGFTRSPSGVCTDVDECLAGTATCDAHASCANTQGSYTCACQIGWSGDGKTCADVNECTAGTAICDANATCTNTQGAYSCACKMGWIGDGKSCTQSFGQIAVTAEHACAVRGDGALYCWGDNSVGQLGTGMGQPGVRVPTRTGAALWKQVAVGDFYTCGIQTDGTLWCWGDDGCGVIGDGNTGNCRGDDPVWTPYPTGGAGTKWLAVATETTHACAIQIDGSLWCWGRNGGGDLGTNDEDDHLVPTRVGTDVGWDVVRVGAAHTCGLRTGQLWCWGSNSLGQLGDGKAETTIAFPKRIGTGSGWVALAAGDQHTCGVLSDQSLACWGSGAHGQLGNGMTGQDVELDAPTVLAGGTLWATVAAGWQETCARTTSGGLYCFGQNLYGQLGDGTFVDRSAPTMVAGSDWASFSVGFFDTCATRTNGQMFCWGKNDLGSLGLGTGAGSPTPIVVSGVHDFMQLSLGAGHACGIRGDRTLWCWGDNSSGQLGLGTTGGGRDTPTPVSGGGTWLAVAAGSFSTCAIQTGGALYCWGANYDGELGIGTSGFDAGSNLPTRVPDPPGAPGAMWTRLTVRASHACAIQSDETLWCWGYAGNGQLGLGDVGGDFTSPTEVGGTGWSAVTAGDGHTCGVQDGTLLCWGQNYFGQCGNGDEPPNAGLLFTPTAIGSDHDWSLVAAGANHTCGLRTAQNALYCWGYNYQGQIGNGSSGLNANVYAPIRIAAGQSWVAIDGGDATTCAIAMNGDLECWGDNSDGLVGNDNAGTVVVTPVVADGTRDWIGVGLMRQTGCALAGSGAFACWGLNDGGEFGDDTTYYESPARVVDPK